MSLVNQSFTDHTPPSLPQLESQLLGVYTIEAVSCTVDLPMFSLMQPGTPVLLRTSRGIDSLDMVINVYLTNSNNKMTAIASIPQHVSWWMSSLLDLDYVRLESTIVSVNSATHSLVIDTTIYNGDLCKECVHSRDHIVAKSWLQLGKVLCLWNDHSAPMAPLASTFSPLSSSASSLFTAFLNTSHSGMLTPLNPSPFASSSSLPSLSHSAGIPLISLNRSIDRPLYSSPLSSSASGVNSGLDFLSSSRSLNPASASLRTSSDVLGKSMESIFKQKIEDFYTNHFTEEMDTPPGLKLVLRNYQRQALHWMHNRERAEPEQNLSINDIDGQTEGLEFIKGGLLCDDMAEYPDEKDTDPDPSTPSSHSTNLFVSSSFSSLHTPSPPPPTPPPLPSLNNDAFKKRKRNVKKLPSESSGLLSVKWYRVVLDEAHTIKERLTHLPEKSITIRVDPFSEEENNIYQELWSASKRKFTTFFQSGTLLKNYAHILELLLRLRQLCDHPFLIRNILKKKMLFENNHGKDDDDEDDDVSSELASLLRSLKSDAFDLSPAELGAQLKKILGKETEDQECLICLEALDNPSLTPCGHLFCTDCMAKQLCFSKSTSNPDTSTTMTPTINISNIQQTMTIDNWKSSTKITSLMEEIDKVIKNEPDSKSLIFSQWTSMLDLVEIPLMKQGISFVRLDGKVPQKHREVAIKRFKEDASVKVFLISMKAGGLGLNLVVASHVFLLDPWWNPATEEQAIDRVYRIGQHKNVFVTRFVIKDSIEERILLLQQSKKNMAQDTLQMKKQIRIEELKMLFGDER
eukprot:gene4244-4952_t